MKSVIVIAILMKGNGLAETIEHQEGGVLAATLAHWIRVKLRRQRN